MEPHRCTSSSSMVTRESTRSRELGIDNQPFIDELAVRGFDHYPDASSVHGYTNLTLADMFAGEVVGPSDDDPIMNTADWNQEQRFNLRWPEPYYVLTLRSATWLPSAGHIGTAAASPTLRRALLRALGLRYRAARSTCRLHRRLACVAIRTQRSMSCASTDASSVFAHLFSPHPAIPLRRRPGAVLASQLRTVRQLDRVDWHHDGGMDGAHARPARWPQQRSPRHDRPHY